MLIRFADSISIDAPAGKVWVALSKWQDPSGWVPQCLSCELLDPPGITGGVGAMRRIQEEDQILTETAIVWEAPSRIAISVTGVPLIVKDVVTTFEVRSISTDTSSFSVTSCSATGLGLSVC